MRPFLLATFTATLVASPAHAQPWPARVICDLDGLDHTRPSDAQLKLNQNFQDTQKTEPVKAVPAPSQSSKNSKRSKKPQPKPKQYVSSDGTAWIREKDVVLSEERAHVPAEQRCYTDRNAKEQCTTKKGFTLITKKVRRTYRIVDREKYIEQAQKSAEAACGSTSAIGAIGFIVGRDPKYLYQLPSCEDYVRDAHQKAQVMPEEFTEDKAIYDIKYDP